MHNKHRHRQDAKQLNTQHRQTQTGSNSTPTDKMQNTKGETQDKMQNNTKGETHRQRQCRPWHSALRPPPQPARALMDARRQWRAILLVPPARQRACDLRL